MKLCKDCVHVAMPSSPLQQVGTGNGYTKPMCGHPCAARDVIDGSLLATCFSARGASSFGPSHESVCWPDAKLFEERPPIVEVEPEVPPPPQPIEPARGWWFDWESIVSSIFR